MARYRLNMQQPHRQCLIDLFNNDNAATLVTPVSLATVDIINEMKLPANSGIPREFTARLVNRSASGDSYDIYYNKVAINSVVTMTDESFDSWYNPFGWSDDVDLAKARSAFYKACRDIGMEPLQQLENIVITREKINGIYCLKVTCKSFVFHAEAIYPIPLYLQDVVYVTDLDGLIHPVLKPQAA